MSILNGIEQPAQTYRLKWANHSNNILQNLIEQFEDQGLVDVTLACEGQFIKAHKMILSACSHFFKDMFKNYDVPHPFIILNNVSFADLNLIIRFMYEGELRVPENEIDTLLKVAESLQVKGLCKVSKQPKPTVEETPTEPAATNINDSAPSNVNPPSRKRRKQSLSPLNTNNEVPIEEQVMRAIDETVAKTNWDEVKRAKTYSRLDKKDGVSAIGKVGTKIPRPPNAFMIFASEWRRKLASEHSGDSNKEISVRLGNLWRSLTTFEKNTYYTAAEKADEEHKLKYPAYYYSPKEARLRKEGKLVSPNNSNSSQIRTEPEKSLIYEINSGDEAEESDTAENTNSSPLPPQELQLFK